MDVSYANESFHDLKTHLEDGQRSSERMQSAAARKKRTTKAKNPEQQKLNDAMDGVHNTVRELMSSKHTHVHSASGYGCLRGAQVVEARKLLQKLDEVCQADHDDDDEKVDKASVVETEKLVASLVRTISPKHRFLASKEDTTAAVASRWSARLRAKTIEEEDDIGENEEGADADEGGEDGNGQGGDGKGGVEDSKSLFV
ncbi:unnamed protein product [Zymoseptoria tritici ST99CH_1E4]|uniref:Uncharacterized protein n=1 Tax=Zymoseptoria tritici ST99CH_1E4 TaxID=1276532 RepID=A0A2H1GNK0_ZYMTR|nr:unnamed protein product [Zymoseptoria tritici ST99CH_1E4]